jgi:hypothetical protein
MTFADYLVSAALKDLSRALVKLAESPQALDDRQLHALADRLLSFWQMVQWSVGKVHFTRARDDLDELLTLTSGRSRPELQAAERLLELAEGRTRRTLGDIIVNLADPRPPQASRARINALLQAESKRWRELPGLRGIPDGDLLEHGMLRAFDKAANLTGKLDAAGRKGSGRLSAKRLQRTHRWTRHAVNHLELLRPALSESGRTRRWHLDRLAGKLNEQWALERFARLAVVVDLKPKASSRFDALIRAERRKLAKQRAKLATGAFLGGSKAYRSEVTSAVEGLHLDCITLLPLEEASRRGGVREVFMPQQPIEEEAS